MTSPTATQGRIGTHSVARVGFGAMQLAERGGLPAPDRQDALAVLRRAVELGVDHIDTADFYGDGVANQLIRDALYPYGDDLVIVTKVGAVHTANGLVPAQRPKELRAGVEANLRRLDVERLAAVNLRRMDAKPGIVATGDQLVDLDAQLDELIALRDEGKIEGIGLSNVTTEQLIRALPAGLVCVQNLYNVLNRTDEPMLELCREHDLAWVPIFPLGSAFPGQPKVSDDPVVIDAAAKLDLSPAQVGLAWLLAHDRHVLLIPGTSSVAHLEQNMAVGDVRLDAATIAALDGLAPTLT